MKSNLKAVPATEVKNRFGDYLSQVVYGREPVYVERHGKPVAVLIGIKAWEAQQAGRLVEAPSSWVEACRKLADDIRKNHPKGSKLSVVEMVRQLRDEAE